MITPENYLAQISTIAVNTLPMPLQKGHDFLMKATAEGSDWATYHNSEAIRKTIQLYFERLDEHINTISHQPKIRQAVKSNNKKNSAAIKTSSRQQATKVLVHEPMMVERTAEELRFIKRFLNLNGKTKTKDELLRFINSLQKAIVEKRIRKTSIYAQQIVYIQQKLIGVYNTMASKIKLELKPATVEGFKNLTASEKMMPSIGFIKRYIAMNGKPGMKEKAKQFLEQINRALDKGKIGDSDPYISEMHELKKHLKSFITDRNIKTLQIEQATLNGLESILGCPCQSLQGINGNPSIMNSMDFAGLEFTTLGFTGKWLQLIGDPSTHFTAMVFGRPKMGKSYLCIDFAGYLARHHGKVLYVAKEEGLDYTLQQKLTEKDVAHPNLIVASLLPENLSQYDFIFLDSVNKLGLSPQDLSRLKETNPTRSFIFVFQTTKDGKFRGANTFQHDVDIVIEVPEKGRAVQYGRFNQGGEIAIF